MPLAKGFAVVGLVALAGCASPPNTSAPTRAVTADAQTVSAASVRKPKNCIVGSHLCTTEQQVDPSVQAMSREAFADAKRGHPIGFSAPN